MKAYGKYGRTVPVFSAASTVSQDVEFSQSDGEDSDNEQLKTCKSEPDTAILSIEDSKIVIQDSIKHSSLVNTEFNSIPSDPNIQEGKFSTSLKDSRIENFDDIQISTPKCKKVTKNNLENEEEPDELLAFDFLNSSSKPKRRKTNYIKHRRHDVGSEDSFDEISYINEKSQGSINKIIQNVSTFLSTLEPEDDHLLEDIFNVDNGKQSEDTYNKEVNNSQKVYNSSRTLLIDNNAEAEEQSMIDDYLEETQKEENLKFDNNTGSSNEVNSSSKNTGRTYHYNELKNMGKSLKYEEDYDYLTNNLTNNSTLLQVISVVLEFITVINSDKNFFRYLKEQHPKDICLWSLKKQFLKSEELVLMQGYILSEFGLNTDQLQSITNIERFIICLQQIFDVPNQLRSNNKLLKLTYKDFLKINGNNSGFDYAIKLWNLYIDKILPENILQLFSSLIRIPKESLHSIIHFDVLYFDLLQKILSNPKFNIQLKDATREKCMLCEFLNDKESLLNEENYLKCLILLTNDPNILDELNTSNKNKIIELSSPFILDYFRGNQGPEIDRPILQLGLCLNVIRDCDNNINDLNNILKNIKSIIIGGNDNFGSNGLLEGLLILNFAYMTIIIKQSNPNNECILNGKEKLQIVNELKNFQTIASTFNETINEKIIYAINEI